MQIATTEQSTEESVAAVFGQSLFFAYRCQSVYGANNGQGDRANADLLVCREAGRSEQAIVSTVSTIPFLLPLPNLLK